MSEKCPVCKTECNENATTCAVCGFADALGINRSFPIPEDLNYWLETVVKPYRVKWEADQKVKEAERKAEEAEKKLSAMQAKISGEQSQQAELLERIKRLEEAQAEASPKNTPTKGHSSISFDSSVEVGSTITFGPYTWRILDVQSGKALILTDGVIEKRAYNEGGWDNVTWERCTLRIYLNGEFLQYFTSEEQNRIIKTRNNNHDNLWYGTKGCGNTDDRVFLLSLEEVDRYFGNSGDYQSLRRKNYENGKSATTNSKGHFFSNAYDNARIAKDADGKEAW